MNTFNPYQHKKIVFLSYIKKNIIEIEKGFDEKLLKFISDNYSEQYFEIIRYLLRKKLFDLDNFEILVKSNVSENLKVFDGNDFRNNKIDANISRGLVHKGNKRPEHSKQLKGRKNEKNSKENWTESRKNYSKNFNSIDWKRKVLENKGIFVDGLDNKTISNLYSNFRKTINASNEYKIKKIENFLTKDKYKPYYDFNLVSKLLENKKIEDCFILVNSLIGAYYTLSIDNNMGNPKFESKTYFPDKLEKCKNIKQFRTRSSYENLFIENFIYSNLSKIDYWIYEPEIFGIDGNLHYIPDFCISINNELYYVELKGYIRDEASFNKINLVIKSFTKNKYLIFLTTPNINITEFLKLKNMQIYKKTHDANHTESELGNSIGLSRNEIIENLLPGSYFIHNGLFLYTIEHDWEEVNFHLIINDRCISEILYSVEKSQILEEHSKSVRFSNLLLQNFENHLEQLDLLKNKINSNVKN
jgi:hypothetical protein